MRSEPYQWFHSFFTDKAQARHHRDMQRGRGRVAKLVKNGAGWEVRWRFKRNESRARRHERESVAMANRNRRIAGVA